jgi:ABC-2 type transport system permease protein
MRYLVIWQQTIFAPLITAALFLLVFSIAIGPDRSDVMGFSYIVFLAPGLLMMTVIQNSFANTSSSMLSAKVMGSIVDTLMPPLSPVEMTIGYLAGGVGRGLTIGLVLCLAMGVTLGVWIVHPIWTFVFVVLGGMFMGALGLIGGIYANKFDQMAAISNFIVTPLAFLSGTFYSIRALPEVLQPLIYLNPMFYIIDGGRYGVLGVSDGSPWVAFLLVCLANTLAVFLSWYWFKKGYRLKS